MELISKLGEQGIIELFGGAPEGSVIAKSVGDDCAALRLEDGGLLLWTTDMLVEGVHFKRYFGTPNQLGGKALAVNLSDIAAMGGKPLACLIGLSMPSGLERSWVEAFRDGFNDASKEYACPLIGGDTCGSEDRISISVSVLGRAEKSEVLWRRGAKDGDDIWISGTPGTSALGLRLLLDRSRDESPVARIAILAQLSPKPRLELGRELARLGSVTACIDTSDGISIDMHHILGASGVGALLHEDSIPLPEIPEVRNYDPLELALRGGEDYHLLFTARQEAREDIEALGGVNRIGEIRADLEGLHLAGEDGTMEALPPSGFSHF